MEEEVVLELGSLNAMMMIGFLKQLEPGGSP
jgi:hypothetical protein